MVDTKRHPVPAAVEYTDTHWSVCTYNAALWFLRGWCHAKLLPSWRAFCVHYTIMHQFIASLLSKSHRVGCISVTSHLHFWQNDRIFYMLLRWNVIEYRSKTESAQKVDPGEETLRSGLEPATFHHESCVLPLSYPRSPFYFIFLNHSTTVKHSIRSVSTDVRVVSWDFKIIINFKCSHIKETDYIQSATQTVRVLNKHKCEKQPLRA